MDTIEEIEQLVIEDFQDFEKSLNVPDLNLVSEARKKVASRKSSQMRERRNWYFPEWLFNFKLRFYHVAILVLLMETAVIFKTRRQGWKEREAVYFVSAEGLASVQNSSLIACPITYNFQ